MSWTIKTWLQRFLPFRRRVADMHALHYVLLSPVQLLIDDFDKLSRRIETLLKYNSQQEVLRSLLNKVFQVDSIRIETVNDLSPEVLLYRSGETAPRDVVLYHSSESGVDNIIYHSDESELWVDFRVFAPSVLQAREVELKAWVNRYKLADKKFEIIYE